MQQDNLANGAPSGPTMNDSDIDYNKIFDEMIGNPDMLLKQDPLLLQNHLSVMHIKKFVEHEDASILEILLGNYESADPHKGASTRDLIEMVVVSCVFYYQKSTVLLHLWPQLQQKDLTKYVSHIKGVPLWDFLETVEPYINFPCHHHSDEILESIRTKRMLHQEIKPHHNCKSVKKI